MSGDDGVVARSFATSSDFRAARLADARRLDRWLAGWHRGKAALLLELANVSTRVAPQFVRPLVGAGRRYLAAPGRPTTADGSAAAFERLWHRIATGILLRSAAPDVVDQYVSGLVNADRSEASSAFVDARLLLARAVAHERRCWDTRPDRNRPGADLRTLARDARDDFPGPGDLMSSPRAVVSSRWHTCLGETIALLEEAGAADETHAEARVRSGWLLFLQGDAPDALQWLESAEPAGDRDLAYWRSLFRGRVLDALDRHQDAAAAYASALEARPGAQSASVGLSLALFRLDRADEAETLARSLRSGAPAVADPWWDYPGADQRFVERWLAELREAVR